jgi:glycosyltransferase involved in cell wall biosynthesis
MLTEFPELGVPFEIVVCENGSTDDTLATLQAYQRRHPEIRVEQLARPDYGEALRHSVSVCSFTYVAMVNVDFWTLDFLRTAVRELATHDVVIGSKIMTGAMDRRPLLRRAITRSFNAFLAIGFGFRGSDTHGMKAMRTAAIAPILPACTSQGWIFDTEMVIRAERAKLRILEVPVHTRELRAPGYWAIVRRVPGVMSNLYRMYTSLRSDSK